KMGVKNMVDNGQGKKRKGPRTVRLTVSAVDPWSVMKMLFLMSVAIGIATIVAFIVLWIVLQATGVMSGLASTMSELAGAEPAERIVGIFGFGRVVAAGVLIAVIHIVPVTALSAPAAFTYNIGSLIAGGFSLTLTDDWYRSGGCEGRHSCRICLRLARLGIVLLRVHPDKGL